MTLPAIFKNGESTGMYSTISPVAVVNKRTNNVDMQYDIKSPNGPPLTKPVVPMVTNNPVPIEPPMAISCKCLLYNVLFVEPGPSTLDVSVNNSCSSLDLLLSAFSLREFVSFSTLCLSFFLNRMSNGNHVWVWRNVSICKEQEIGKEWCSL